MKVSGLYVYPIKACGGIALSEVELVERGFAHDRRYMLVDRAGTFVTQRDVAKLALVRTQLAGDQLHVDAPGQAQLRLPLTAMDGELVKVRVWGDWGNALCEARGSQWFSELLSDAVRLVYMPESERRSVNPARARPGDIVSFADGYPLLLISEASLDDLNRRLPAPIGMQRFRPNIVISGAAPYAEDDFSELAIGGLSFRAVKRCDRCVVTTIDPETVERGPEPLKTLAGYRRWDGAVWFGMNLIHDGRGKLRLGDPLQALPKAAAERYGQ